MLTLKEGDVDPVTTLEVQLTGTNTPHGAILTLTFLYADENINNVTSIWLRNDQVRELIRYLREDE